jgi:O-antigen ligase
MGVYRLMWFVPVVLIGFAVVFFFYKLATLMFSKNTKGREDAKGMITFGLIAIFVMVSLWGIVKMVQESIFPGGFIVQPGK